MTAAEVVADAVLGGFGFALFAGGAVGFCSIVSRCFGLSVSTHVGSRVARRVGSGWCKLLILLASSGVNGSLKSVN
jgi:hypothetical protein